MIPRIVTKGRRFFAALAAVWAAQCGGGRADTGREAQPPGPTAESSGAAGVAGDAAVASTDAAAELALVPAARDDGRLPETAVPLGYELALEIDPTREDFRGTVRVRVRVPRPTRAIVMHARELTVTDAALLDERGRPAAPATVTSRPGARGRGTPEELVLTFATPVLGDSVLLSLAYTGRFNPALRGLYRVQQNRRWYAFTQFEPNDARRAFPCFDEPGFKVPWTITVTAPADQVVAANMPEQARTALSDGRARVRFAESPPTPSYLVALAVGPFDVVDHGPVTLTAGGSTVTVPLRGIATRGQGPLLRESLQVAAEHLDVLSRYFDRAYPYPKLDLVAVPEFGAGAMENPGLVTFREEMLLLDPARATASARRGIAGIIAHELAHQWFGNLVTMRWWDDLWLNEGFATWMATRVLDTWRPAMGSRVEAVRSRGWAMEEDSLPTARVVRQPVRSTSEAEEAFDGITYTKGAAFLRMVEAAVGEDRFREGIRSYIRAHAWGNATAADLFDDLRGEGRVDVSAVAASFLDRRGVPMVRAEARCPAGGTPTIELSQRPYRPLGSPELRSPAATVEADPWRIPLCVSFDQGPGAPGRVCTVLDQRTATIPAGRACPRWVHPNAGESAYVRYELTDPVRALFEPARWRTLDAAARVGLVDAAWAQLRAGALPVESFLALLGRVRDERDRVVLDAISSGLTALLSHHATPETRPRLRALVATVFRPSLARLGWTPRPQDTEDDKLLRRAAISVLGSVALDPPTLAEADRLARRYLEDPASVAPDVALQVLPVASLRGDNARVDALLARLRAPGITPQERTALQTALVTFTEPAVLQRGLDLVLTDAVRQADVTRLLWVAATHPDRRAVVHPWIRAHYDGIVRRVTDEGAARLAGIAGDTCDEEARESWVSFWTPRIATAEGAERALREGVDGSVQCQALRESIAPGLARWR
jgi:alanyl aminopeptidase